MKKTFKPFWSYDIEDTERWLEANASKGHQFSKFNRWTRCFYFYESEAKTMTYRISFDKVQVGSLPRTLTEEGWKLTSKSGNWSIMGNNKAASEIKAEPVREGVFRHNQWVMYGFIGILCYLAGVLLIPGSMFVSSWIQGTEIQVEPSPWWALTYSLLALAILAVVLAIYSIVKISRTSKAFGKESVGGEVEPGKTLSKQEEKDLKRSGRMVTKVKLGWMYAPDKLEQWLEKMGLQGYNLHRVSKIGTVFYFIKGRPRRMAYRADYQNMVNDSYFNLHRDAGWEIVFNSYSGLEKWTIWRQEYAEGKERPELYSDPSTHLKHARRISITYTVLFLPLIVIYLANIMPFLTGEESAFSWHTMLFVLFLVLFTSFIFRMWAYYRRLRKSYCAF